MKKALALIVLFFLLAGCRPAATADVTPAITPTASLAPTSRPTPASTIAPTPVAALAFLYPQMAKVCPARREVPVSQLGIAPGSSLILADAGHTGIWVMALPGGAPSLVSNISPDDLTSGYVSPDGVWFAYRHWNPDLSASIVAVSLKSGEKEPVLDLKYWEGLAPELAWLSGQDLLVANHCHTRGCHFPLDRINIDTGVVTALDIATHSDPFDLYQTLFENGERPYALYSTDANGAGYTRFYVYDYAAGKQVPVFGWLDQRVFPYPYFPTNFSLSLFPDATVMFIEQSYGFDLGVVDNSLADYTQPAAYDDLMKRVVTRPELDQLNYFPVAVDASADLLYLDMSYLSYEVSVDREVPVNKGFFSLDYRNVIPDNLGDSISFKDYCFSMVRDHFQAISPDGQIAVFENEQSNRITLLNLATGNLARLPGWVYLGWRPAGQ